MSTANLDPAERVARRLDLPERGVRAGIDLLESGNTVPFIARYRKEATGGLDEVALAAVEEAYKAVQALEKRREAIIEAIRKDGKLDPALELQLRAAPDRTSLEDLYLPYKRKRKTRGSAARERGLTPLAERILAQPRDGHPEREAARFARLGSEVPDVEAALAGARDIVAEVMAERADLRDMARQETVRNGRLSSRAAKKATEGKRTRFEDFYDFEQPLQQLPSHRYLAIRRGETEGVLRVGITLDAESLCRRLDRGMRVAPGSPWAGQLREAIREGYKRLLAPSIANEIRGDIGAWAEGEAVDVFATNTRNLLLAAPYGQKAVIGIDPGFRSGCKCAALGATGRFLGHLTLHPHTVRDAAGEARKLVDFVRRHRAEAVAIGNGTAGRETLDFVREALAESGARQVIVVSVSEDGASIYSASEIARLEFPDLDLTVRGAISIGRRLQDPLAELVKVDPRSLGVGQYQHDVAESRLRERLGQVVQICVNRVGVELNTASAALLEHVAGIGPTLARRIVDWRDAHGPFTSREQLLSVSGLGKKTFEQAAGFLRIHGAANPLDASAVHPERYALVERMSRDLGTGLSQLVGNAELARRIDVRRYVGDDVGEPTLRDILSELARPGRDPRPPFEPPRFREDVNTPEDLRKGMILEGVVTNVTSFGAFVDIGVHTDGLVHISRLADHFVRDPHEVVRVGQRLKVEVIEVDLARERISLGVK